MICYCLIIFFFKASRASFACSCPPRPKASPPAIASIATSPVKKILIRSCATPSWLSMMRTVKNMIVDRANTASELDALSPALFTLCRTTSEVRFDMTIPTNPMMTATITLGI